MLLRRISKHIEDQNWFAVGLDFLIVVIGVFIGLQVQQWSEEQKQRQLEASYIQRLHDEVVDLQELREPLIHLREGWSAQLTSATQVLFGETDRPITEEECRSIAFSYATTNPTDDLASLVELQSSVRLATFRNQSVSKALQSYLLTRARIRDANAGVISSLKILISDYPGLIQVVSPSVFSPLQSPGTYRCDVQGMRADPAFMNDYDFVQGNYLMHVRANQTVSDSLAELHRVLDEVLGMTHTRDESRSPAR